MSLEGVTSCFVGVGGGVRIPKKILSRHVTLEKKILNIRVLNKKNKMFVQEQAEKKKYRARRFVVVIIFEINMSNSEVSTSSLKLRYKNTINHAVRHIATHFIYITVHILSFPFST